MMMMMMMIAEHENLSVLLLLLFGLSPTLRNQINCRWVWHTCLHSRYLSSSLLFISFESTQRTIVADMSRCLHCTAPSVHFRAAGYYSHIYFITSKIPFQGPSLGIMLVLIKPGSGGWLKPSCHQWPIQRTLSWKSNMETFLPACPMILIRRVHVYLSCLQYCMVL